MDGSGRGIYGTHARFYDAIYAAMGRDVEAEVERLEAVWSDLGLAPTTVLDVSCGTGVHLEAMRARGLAVVGTDVSAGMLAVARERLPDVELVEADFLELDLGRTFDAVTSMFSSIGHAGRAGLDRAVENLAAHVAAGGGLFIEPWVTSERLRPEPSYHATSAEVDGAAVSRTTRSTIVDGDVHLEFGWTVADAAGLRFEVESMVVEVVPQQQLLEAVARAGLEPSWVDDHGWGERRGLVVGLKGI